MAFDFQRARALLQSGNLAKLFVEELGWEPSRLSITLRAGQTDYALTAIAEKKSFTVRLCACKDGCLPDHSTRLKLDRALAHTSFEHLIVFAKIGVSLVTVLLVASTRLSRRNVCASCCEAPSLSLFAQPEPSRSAYFRNGQSRLRTAAY